MRSVSTSSCPSSVGCLVDLACSRSPNRTTSRRCSVPPGSNRLRATRALPRSSSEVEAAPTTQSTSSSTWACQKGCLGSSTGTAGMTCSGPCEASLMIGTTKALGSASAPPRGWSPPRRDLHHEDELSLLVGDGRTCGCQILDLELDLVDA